MPGIYDETIMSRKSFLRVTSGVLGAWAVGRTTSLLAAEESVAEKDVAADGGTFGIWLIAAFVAALAAAGVTWLIRRPTADNAKDTKDEENQGKVMVMETIENVDRDVGTARETTKPNRWPTVLIVVLAVVLVGLVAWMVFMMRPNSPTAAPPEIAQLMEDYNAAWNAHDADALEALVTDDYRIYGPASAGFDHDIESVRSYLMPLLDSWDWQVTEPGPMYAVNTSGYVWAVTGEGSTITRNGSDHEQNAVFTVVGPGETYLVREHYMVGG